MKTKQLIIMFVCILNHVSTAMTSPQRAIPFTDEARQQIRSIRDGMPEDWPFVGMVRPKSAKEIGYSLLGIGGEVLDRDFADFHAYKEYVGPLGAKRIRLQSGWAKTEKERDVYDFTWLDRIIDSTLECGVAPWLSGQGSGILSQDPVRLWLLSRPERTVGLCSLGQRR